MKVLVFSPSDGSVWHIPAEVVARLRAECYARGMVLKGHDYQTAFNEVYESFLASDSAMTSWFQYTLHWDAVADVAKMIEPPSYERNDLDTADVMVKEVSQ